MFILALQQGRDPRAIVVPELVLTTARGDTVRITRYLVRSALPAPAPVAAAVAPPG